MPSPAELRNLPRARLADAIALFRSRRYGGAYYLCGYLVEMRLKARICTTLKWTDYPEKGDLARCFMVHNLETLLRLSGRESRMKDPANLPNWSTVILWQPQMRYNPKARISWQLASEMIQATQALLKVI